MLFQLKKYRSVSGAYIVWQFLGQYFLLKLLHPTTANCHIPKRVACRGALRWSDSIYREIMREQSFGSQFPNRSKINVFFIVQAIAKPFLTSIYTHSRMSKTKVRLENQKNHTHTHFGILHNTIAICSITVLTNRQKNAWLLKTCVVFTGEGRHTKISKKIKFLLSLNFLWKIRNCQKFKCRQLLCCNTLIFSFYS